MKRALKWYIFHQILIILKISVILQCKTSNGIALQWKNWYFSVISVDFSNISKNEQFSLENHWSIQDLTGETSF